MQGKCLTESHANGIPRAFLVRLSSSSDPFSSSLPSLHHTSSYFPSLSSQRDPTTYLPHSSVLLPLCCFTSPPSPLLDTLLAPIFEATPASGLIMLGTWDPSSKRTSRKKPSSSGSKLNTPPPPSTSPGSYNPPGPSTSTAPGSPPIPGSYPEYFKPPTTGRPAISAASPFPDEVHISDVFSDPARPVQPPPPVHESPPFSLSPAAARYWRLRRTYRVPLVFGSIQEATEEVEEGGRTGGAETITGMIPQVAPPVPLIPCEGLLSPTFRPANPTLSALGLTGIREASDEGDSEGEQAENPADETRRRRAREKRKRQDKKRKEQRRQRVCEACVLSSRMFSARLRLQKYTHLTRYLPPMIPR